MEIDIDLICKNLQSLERSERHKALKELLKYCEDDENKNNLNNKDEESKIPSPTASLKENLIEVYDKCYLHILKCYSDRFESCRELACNVITAFLKKLPKNDYYLQYIVKTIASRLGQKELQEHSEEIRLTFLKQINFLIDRFHYNEIIGDPLLKSYNDIIDIFLKTLTDSYPLVQRETCNCIKLLANATPSFHYRAETLTKFIYPILNHKHSANRIIAIQTLGIICLHIRTNTECIIQIISEVSPLVMDSQPLVRKTCGQIGCCWLLELRDRYSFFERILPIVLCCLKDDSPEVREEIEKLWIKCGKLYFEENQTELDKIEMIDKKPNNYPDNIKRPTLGCRALVQRNLKFVKSVMWETSDWKEEIRLHSLKLMWQIVLHAEKYISKDFMEIFPHLSRACEDTDVNVAKMATTVAELIGRLMIYEDWFDLALDYMETHPKLGVIKCFYFHYLGSKANKKNDILKIAKLLSQKEFSNSLKVEVQNYLLKLIDLLWERYQQEQEYITIDKNNKEENKKIDDTNSIENAMKNLKLENDEIEKYIYHILIKIMALSFEEITNQNDENLNQKYGKIILKKLAKENDNLILELHKNYLNSVIETFDSLEAELDEYSEPILLLYGIIRICGFQKEYLISLKNCIQIVWNNAASDGKVKIFSAISIAMLSWNITILYNKNDENLLENNKEEENFQLLYEFIKDIVEPYLIWKAGASAESMRSIATATLYSMTQSVKNESKKILLQYSSIFQNLIEDNCITTRIYALKCLNNFGPMKYEQLRPIAYAALQRLDDPSAEVRMWSAKILCKFDTSELNDNDQSSWHAFIKQALKMLFLHYDGPEIKLKKVIKDTIIEISKQYPEIYDEIYSKIYAMCANKDELNEIQKIVKA